MDELDETIAAQLEMDGRCSYRTVGRAVGLSRAAVATRANRLIDSGRLAIRGAVNPYVQGQRFRAYISLEIIGGASEVAARLAPMADMPFVSIVTGPRAIVAEVRSASVTSFMATMDEVRTLEGVDSSATLTYLEVIRDAIGPSGTVGTARLDRVDCILIEQLQKDGRTPYVKLAALAGLSPAGARRRVTSLVFNRVIKIGAIVRHSDRDSHLAMDVGVRLSGAGSAVTTALSDLDGLVFMARTAGTFDVLLTVRAFSASHLSSTLDHIGKIPGVADFDCWSHLRIVKEDYESRPLTPGDL